jgi:hypothetical protein
MTDLYWILIVAGATGAVARASKVWPQLPKGLTPWVALAIGYALMATRLVVEGVALGNALLEAWTGLAAGVVAVGGHRTLKPLLVAVFGDGAAVALLGRLPGPPQKVTAKPKPRSSIVFLVLLAGMPLLGCGPSSLQAQAVVAATLAKATNTALPGLVAIYQAEGEAVINSAGNAEEALAALAEIRKQWRPIWEAWDVWQTAHDAWATAIEQGTESLQFWTAMRAAYCELRGALAGRVELPDMPVAACGGTS